MHPKFFAGKDLNFKTMEEFNPSADQKFDLIISSHVFKHINVIQKKSLENIKYLSDWFLLEVPLRELFGLSLLLCSKQNQGKITHLGMLIFGTK